MLMEYFFQVIMVLVLRRQELVILEMCVLKCQILDSILSAYNHKEKFVRRLTMVQTGHSKCPMLIGRIVQLLRTVLLNSRLNGGQGKYIKLQTTGQQIRQYTVLAYHTNLTKWQSRLTGNTLHATERYHRIMELYGEQQHFRAQQIFGQWCQYLQVAKFRHWVIVKEFTFLLITELHGIKTHIQQQMRHL
uniref:Uncharacterized protein n=1 Tax=viral metagenome TaxID=1070528 RepID=A0A6C0F226_9ZZZZ